MQVDIDDLLMVIDSFKKDAQFGVNFKIGSACEHRGEISAYERVEVYLQAIRTLRRNNH